MAASTAIYQYTGSGPTTTSITNLRYKTADDPSGTDTTYPLVKPSAGTNYSYLTYVALFATTGPASTLNNIKWYSDGSSGLGTGITIKGKETNTYAQATGTQGTSGDLSSSYFTSGTDVFTYTSGSPASITSNATSGNNTRYSYYWATQMSLSTSVTPGTTSTETFTFRYDET